MFRRSVFILILAAVASALPAAQSAGDNDVIAIERASLERWIKGDPGGFLSNYAPDVTYYDPSQERRIDGLQAMTAYLAPLRGKIRIDRFEMLNTKVQRYGDIAVLTYNVVNYQKQPDGKELPTTRWNSTAVFHRLDGRWREVHSHFSFTQPAVSISPPSTSRQP